MAAPAAAKAPWRVIAEHLRSWKRDAYVPLRVALTADEQQRHRVATPSIIAGYVRKDQVERLHDFSGLLEVTSDQVLVRPVFTSVAERTKAFADMTNSLKSEGVFPEWQNELCEAKTAFDAPTLFHYHRGVGEFFGLSKYATYLNGFVRDESAVRQTRSSSRADAKANGSGVSHVWIAKRSQTKKAWPGLLDTIVGGGLPADISTHENMVKETNEEAGLDPSWVAPRLVSTGSICYVTDQRSGLVNNVTFTYDLEMPPSMEPVNQDGEVESFELWPVEEVVAALGEMPMRFKPDIYFVLLDFCIRHGIVTPHNFPSYEELQAALQRETNPYIDA